MLRKLFTLGMLCSLVSSAHVLAAAVATEATSGAGSTAGVASIIYDNTAPNGGINSSGAVPASQYDAVFPFDAGVADDFVLPASPECQWTINEIHWSGMYWSTEDRPAIAGFRIIIWPDNDGEPAGGGFETPDLTQALAVYDIAGAANETPRANSSTEYDYIAVLPQPFHALPGVRYWLEIQVSLPWPPQWGWHVTAGRQGDGPVKYFDLLRTLAWSPIVDPGDLAFQLHGVPRVVTCDDQNACTADTCVAGECMFTSITCDDGDACTSDSCDAATGCTTSAITCDDGNACTTDSCDPSTGCTTASITCDDGDACTTDSCDPVTGCTTTAITCDDGNACTEDSCEPSGACLNTQISCDDPTDADDCASGILDCTSGTPVCTDDAALDDADGDGIWDCNDNCDGNDGLIGQACDGPADQDTCTAGIFDCTSGTLICTDDAALDDEDGDGVWDCNDDCFGTAPNASTGTTGCSCSQLGLGAASVEDADSDTIPDGCDNCPNTPNTDQADSDGDSIGDACDSCDGSDALIGLTCDDTTDADDCASGVFDCTSGTLICTDDAALDDADGDGIWDCNDNCDGDDALIGIACDDPTDADDCASGLYDCTSGTLICTDDAALDDADGDGIWDCNDGCDGDDALIGMVCDDPTDADNCASGVYDCASGTLACTDDTALDDADGDGIWDCDDDCEGDEALIGQACDNPTDTDDCSSGIFDCTSGTLVCTDDAALDDEDGDGVWDCNDDCLGTASDASTGTTGCSCSQLGLGAASVEDADSDTIPDGCDNCPNTANTDQADSDGDAIGDACDNCDGDDALIGLACDSPTDADDCASGVFNCTSGTLNCTDDDALDDADGDGIWDCEDPCDGDNTMVGQGCDDGDGCTFDSCENGECVHSQRGDLDGDGDVDETDYSLFVNCQSAPNSASLSVECTCSDFNGDGYVDMLDYAAFQAAFTGSK